MATKTRNAKGPKVTQTTFTKEELTQVPGRCPGCGSILVQTSSSTACYEAALGRCDRTSIGPRLDPAITEQLLYEEALRTFPHAKYHAGLDRVSGGYHIEGHGEKLFDDCGDARRIVAGKRKRQPEEVLAVIGKRVKILRAKE